MDSKNKADKKKQKEIERINKALDEMIDTSNRLNQSIPYDLFLLLELRLCKLENA
jgi:hypothetical protein